MRPGMRIRTWQKVWLVAGGVCLAFVLLEGGLRFAGFIYLKVQEHQNQVALRHKDSVRILCIGESTTAVGGSDSYPRQLEDVLREGEAPGGRSFVVINKGIPGTDTSRIVNALPHYLETYKPDIVVAMMGINDTYRMVAYEGIEARGWRDMARELRVYKLWRLLRGNTGRRYQGWMGGGPQQERDSQNLWEQGLKHLRGGNAAEARRLFKQHSERYPEDDRGYWGLGACSAAEEDYEQAIALQAKAVALNPDNDWAYAGLGWCYFALQDIKTATEMFSQAVRINSLSEDGHNGLGWCALKQGDYETAEGMFRQTISHNRRNGDAWHGLGVCMQRQEKHREAAVLFEKSLKVKGSALSSFEAEVWQGLGDCLTYEGRFGEAATALETSRRIKDSAVNLQNTERKEYYDALYKLGVCYWEQNNTAKARLIFQRILDEGNGAPDMLCTQIGWTWMREGNHVQAQRMFEQALALNSRNDMACLGMGWCYQLSGEFARAREMFENTLSINPDRTDALVGLGETYRNLGKNEQAARSYQELLRRNPWDENAAAGLAKCFVQQKEYQKAIEIFSIVDPENPKHENIYLTIGKYRLAAGEYAEAEAMFGKALSVNPNYEQAYAGLMRAYEQQGRHELARAAEQQVMRLRRQLFSPQTRTNFRRVTSLLEARNIPLVLVSYPCRSAAQLKRLFDPGIRVIFVDNELPFKKALSRGRYEDFFTDNFAGDFGHCTPRGNRLLADNIASHIRALWEGK